MFFLGGGGGGSSGCRKEAPDGLVDNDARAFNIPTMLDAERLAGCLNAERMPCDKREAIERQE